MENSTVVGIPCTRDLKFFQYWVEFLKPFHKGNQTESNIIAYYLYKRFELNKKVKDPELLNRLLFSEDTRKEICKFFNYQANYFRCVYVKLRKKGLITDNGINPKLVPRFKDTGDDYKLIIHFRFSEN